MTKIALLCNGYGVVNRGAEIYTKKMYDILSDTFDIDIYGIKETDHSIGIPSKTRDEFRFPWRNGRAYLESYYFCKKWYKLMISKPKKKYDVVLNNAGFPGSYWCSKYRKKTGTPFIAFERGGGKEEKINLFFKPDCMSFLTKASQDKFSKKKVKSAVLPVGIDIDAYAKSKPKSKLLEGLERPVFLSTSAIVGFKRINLIIKAISEIDRGTFLQTSTGDMKDEIVRLGNNLLGNRFKYVGVVPREELLQLYKHSNVFINASKHEAFGNVYTEAMASGLPVVTQNDERRKEVVGDAGIFIDCEDIQSFAKALSKAAETDWGDKPYNQAKKFSWKTLKSKYVDLIKEVAN